MQTKHLCCFIVLCMYNALAVTANPYDIKLSHDGPVVQGGTITFRADLYYDGQKASGTFRFVWRDDAIPAHSYVVEKTYNSTTYWSVSYPPDQYQIGSYEVEVVALKPRFPYIYTLWYTVTRKSIRFEITPLLNGNMTIMQSNETVADSFVSSAAETQLNISVRKGDYDYIVNNATSITTFWFIDCKFFGQTDDFSFKYNFTNPDVAHTLEALVVASFEPLTTTTVLPPTTTPIPTTLAPNSSVPNSETSTTLPPMTTTLPSINSTVNTTVATSLLTSNLTPDTNVSNFGNATFPFVCLNSSVIPPDPKKTYGYFYNEINVRAPISNIVVEGTNWIQPWDMLNLNVICKGSGPFRKCLQYYRGKYNVTGNETCDNAVSLPTCNFSIVRYFLEPSVYTILVIMDNEVSKEVYPLTINIYKVTTKPQLSVIIVPVSCTLAAVVLVIFGIAYYVQSRARFTVEVADFDFGQHNPEMEYKTFTERLRDSFNNALNPGNKRINGYKTLGNT